MIEYLTVEQVIELHDEMIKRYGGLAGIRDRNLLLSAVDSPKATMFGNDLYPSIYDKAAVYLYQIVCNHPFNDANKRTGYATVLVFLDVNNTPLKFKKEDLEQLVVELAQGKVSREELSRFLIH